MPLATLVTERIGEAWIKDLDQLARLRELADDPKFREDFMEAKAVNKRRLAKYLFKEYGIEVSPASMFDLQVKRIHEYKRQLLNAFHIVTLYNRIKKNPRGDFVPRTILIGGKAAPGYYMAKMIIKLITSIAQVVNTDADVCGRLKVLFLENYRVSLAEKIIPAADLSEQISTAGTEASGTGNMKFMINGALTIGTLDGANVEMRQEVGPDNIYIFGMTVEEVAALKRNGYDPVQYYESNPALKEVIDKIRDGFFSPDSPDRFHNLVNSLLVHGDRFCLLADYQAYVDMQDRISAEFRDKQLWARKCILNVAAGGFFSSDRTIKQYANDIWRAVPVPLRKEKRGDKAEAL